MHPFGVFRSLLPLLFVLFCLPASAAPALWVTNGSQAKIYLFGTVHMLRLGTVWRSPALDRAIGDSREIWLELAESDPAATQALALRYGIDAAHPLSSRLPQDMIARLDAAAAAAGVPGGEKGLEPLRPWLAAVTLGLFPLQKAGYQPDLGADDVIRKAAQAAGKPVNGLETVESQIRLMADLPETLQEQFLASSLDPRSLDASIVDGLVASWQAGDDAGMDKFGNMIRDEAPALYRRLLVERNEAFAARIVGMLAQSGTVLVAVGAEHLVGPDSVQNDLARRGIETHRVAD